MTAIAEAFVAIRPQTTGFEAELKSQLSSVGKTGAQVPVTANTTGLVQKTQTASKEAGAKSTIAPQVNPNTKGLQGKLSSEFKKIAGIATGIFAGIFIVKGAADFLKGAVEKADEAQQAQLRLNVAFDKFPKLANISKEALLALNEQLSRKTKFDRDAFASGEAVLAQFNLTGQQIKQVIPLVADYAAKTGKDLPAASLVVGKALLGNARALKSVGVEFKSTGDRTKDFDLLMAKLSDKVGGFATKEGATFSGRIAIMKNQLGELQKTIGNAVLPIFIKIADFLTNSFFPALSKIGNFLVTVFRPAFDVVRDAASKLFSILSNLAFGLFKRFSTSSQALASALKDIGPAILAIGAAFIASQVLQQFQTFTTAIRGIQKAAAAAGGGVGVLKAGVSALVNLLTPTNLLIGGIAAATFLWVRANIQAKEHVQAIADALQQEADGLKNATDQFFLNQFAQDGTLQRLNKLGISVSDFITAIKQGGPAFDAVNQSIQDTGKNAAQFVDVLTPLGHITTDTGTDTVKLTRTLGDERNAFKDGASAAALKAKGAQDLANKTKDAANATKQNTDATNANTDAAGRYARAVTRENLAVQALQDHFKTIAGTVDHFKASLDASLGTLLNVQDATARYDQDLSALGDSLKKNGHQWDLNTQKGRDNSQALRTVITDIEDQIGALVKAGKIQSNDTAQKNALLGRLKELETKYPAVKGQVDAYITSVQNIPVVRSTTIKSNAATAKKAIDDLRTSIAKIPGAVKNVEFRALQDALSFNKTGITPNIHLDTSTMTVNATNVTVTTAPRNRMAGGPVSQGSPFIVGEKGPELFVPQTSGTIVPNNKMASSGLTDAQVSRIIAAIDRLVAMRPIHVTEVANDPLATAAAVSSRLGAAGNR